MRNYLEGLVVVWNETPSSCAKWNNTTNYEYRNTTIVLDMNTFDASVAELFIDGFAQSPGNYTGTSRDWIDGTGILTVTGAINDFST